MRAQLQALERELLRRLARATPQDVAVLAAVRRLEAARGQARIDDLAEAVGVSRQHLTRRFSQQVGLTPKLLARILRIQALTQDLARATPTDWALIARAAGFGDQSPNGTSVGPTT